MKIGIIGAGRVGTSFAKLLVKNGFDTALYSKSGSADTKGIFSYDSAYRLCSECEVIFVTVPDGRIADVWKDIRPYASGRLMCHMSGAISADVFDGACRRASLHPMMAVPDKNSDGKMAECFYTVEGTSAFEVEALFPMLRIRRIESRDKIKYHAAAVMASNLVTSLIDVSTDVLVSCGFRKEEALSAIEVMAKSNLAAVFDKGLTASLTGPLERCDTETVKKHLRHLHGEEKDAYIILSKHLIKIAEEKNPDRDYEAVKAIFSEGCVLN